MQRLSCHRLFSSPLLSNQYRHITRPVNRIDRGDFIKENGRYLEVQATEHLKKARNPAFITLESSDVISGKKYSKRYRPAEEVDFAETEIKNVIFKGFKNDMEQIIVEEESTGESFTLNTKDHLTIEDDPRFLKEGESYMLHYDTEAEKSIYIVIPSKTEDEIVEIEAEKKGMNDNFRRAVLKCGVTIRVPGFVKLGDRVMVNTKDKSYDKRIE